MSESGSLDVVRTAFRVLSEFIASELEPNVPEEPARRYRAARAELTDPAVVKLAHDGFCALAPIFTGLGTGVAPFLGEMQAPTPAERQLSGDASEALQAAALRLTACGWAMGLVHNHMKHEPRRLATAMDTAFLERLPFGLGFAAAIAEGETQESLHLAAALGGGALGVWVALCERLKLHAGSFRSGATREQVEYLGLTYFTFGRYLFFASSVSPDSEPEERPAAPDAAVAATEQPAAQPADQGERDDASTRRLVAATAGWFAQQGYTLHPVGDGDFYANLSIEFEGRDWEAQLRMTPAEGELKLFVPVGLDPSRETLDEALAINAHLRESALGTYVSREDRVILALYWNAGVPEGEEADLVPDLLERRCAGLLVRAASLSRHLPCDEPLITPSD